LRGSWRIRPGLGFKARREREGGTAREDGRRRGDACSAPKQSREEERRRLTGGPERGKRKKQV